MATQGIVSVVKDGIVRMKLVAGSDGYHALTLADWLRSHPGASPQMAFDKACEVGFGSTVDLIVQYSPKEFIADPSVEVLPSLYRVRFLDSKFNPRWEHGTADFVEVVAE